MDNRTNWQRWCDFFFRPADPTPLAYMRVVTGIVILYVHAAYCFDLQAFFGKDGWYSLKAINRERLEYPVMISSFRSWTEVQRAANLPEFPHRRLAVLGFIRGMPMSYADRTKALAYITRLQNANYNPTAREGLEYLERVGVAGEGRKARLDALEDEKLRTAVDFVPDSLGKLTLEERKKVRQEILDLLEVLPQDVYQRQFVLNHLTEMELQSRKLFLEFIFDLPDNAAEREKRIDYLAFWNNEARRAYSIGHPIFSVWFHVTDPTTMAVIHGAILGIMLMFTLGICTRVTSVLTWFAAMSYIHRTQHVLFGMDTMMNLLLIYLMVGNCGATFSIDRLVRRYRAARHGLARSGNGTIDSATRNYLHHVPKSVSAGFALRMVQIHFCFIYMASGLSKLKGTSWWNTTAFWDTMINPEFTPVQFSWYEALLRWAITERWMFAIACTLGIIFTFVMEIGLPFLVWTRLRPYIVMGAVGLHMGIAIFMGLNLFGMLMLTLLLSYLPPKVFRDQFFPPGDRRRKLLKWPAAEPQGAAWALALDHNSELEVADGPKKLMESDREVPPEKTVKDLLGFWRFVPGIRGKLA
ncbi:MAG: hypothetical protein ACRCZF_14715 [Gemmataceae bacterium]